MLKNFKKTACLENVLLLLIGWSEGFGMVEDEDGGKVQMRNALNKQKLRLIF